MFGIMSSGLFQQLNTEEVKLITSDSLSYIYISKSCVSSVSYIICFWCCPCQAHILSYSSKFIKLSSASMSLGNEQHNNMRRRRRRTSAARETSRSASTLVSCPVGFKSERSKSSYLTSCQQLAGWPFNVCVCVQRA